MFSNNTAGAGGGAIYNNNGIMTITDSTFSENYVDGDGAAIYNQGTMTVTGSIFLNNHAVGGGGVYNKGDLTITESSFSNNTASSYGGGMWNDSGNVILTDSSFTGNYANGGGAGIENFGAGNSLVITNSVFSNNSVSSDYGSGGGIEHSGGTIDEPGLLTITNSIFVNNSARNGGGIYTTGTAMVASSTFVDNTAIGFDGGAIYHFLGGTLTVANSTFYNNSANYSGGGISSSAGDSLILINNSFSNNSAGDKGGGIYAGDVSYANNIIANSTSGGDCHIYGVISINKNNLVEDGSCIASLSGDPKLGLLADNGGPTQTMALQSGSPAIDAGDDVACAASPINNLDQRGMTRPMGTHCDIGAYELDYLFADVADTYWAASYIERLYNAGITGGCATNPLRYCPESDVSRAQMAVFLLKGVHGSSYTPPAVGGSTGFADVPTSYWAAPWIKQLAAEGVTGGCGGGNFCPDTPVTRAQMAVFLLKGVHGSSYSPPPVGSGTGFADVPTTYWAAPWIKQLAAEGITGGCGGGNFCPDTPVTRAQMAVFLLKSKHGVAYLPPAATGVFADVPVGYWADKWIYQLAAEGFTGG
ncbi:MAG: hypothetical protein C3F07_02520, partial [Anaerolineales bacterium]